MVNIYFLFFNFFKIYLDAVGFVIVIVTALVSWLLDGYDWLKVYIDPTLRCFIQIISSNLNYIFSIILVMLIVCTIVPFGEIFKFFKIFLLNLF